MLRLTKEFMQDVECWRWRLKEGMTGEGERLEAPFFSSVKQTHKMTWFSDASFETVGGVFPGEGCVLEIQLVRGEVKKTYAQGWRICVSWRIMRAKGDCLGGDMNEWELVEELAEFMAYSCAERKNKEAVVAGKLVAVNVYREQWVGLSLPMQHVRMKAARKGIKRAHVEAGNQTRVRRARMWEVIRVMEESIAEWGWGGG